MSNETNHVSVSLDDQEMEAVKELQRAMGLDDPSEVMQLLVRQAAQRALVVCPACGHSAGKTSEDEAMCASCMSVIHLSEGIWQVISAQ